MEQFLATLGNPWGAVAVVLGYWLAATLLGWLVLRAAQLDGALRVLAPVVGLNLLAIVETVYALSTFFHPRAVQIALAVCAATGAWWVIRDRRQLCRGLGRGPGVWLALLPLLVLFGFGLSRSLTLPVNWDELTYQVCLPVHWTEARFPLVFADNPYSGFPLAGTIHFWFLTAAGGVYAPRLFVWCLWLATCLLLYALFARRLPVFGAAGMAFCFGTSNAVLIAGSSAFVELLIAGELAAVLYLLEVRRHRELAAGDLWLLALFGSGAAAVKLTGLFVGLCVGGAAVVLWRNRRVKTSSMLGFAVVSFCVLALFYGRSWLATGNPFYPYWGHVFGKAGPALQDMSRFHHAIGSSKFGFDSWGAFLYTPLAMTLDRSVCDGDFGWGVLLVLPLLAVGVWLWLRGQLPTAAGFSLAFALLLYCAWFATAQQARFLIPAWVAAMVWVHHVVAVAGKRYGNRVTWGMAAAFLCLGMVSIPRPMVQSCLLSWNVVAGRIRVMDYLYSTTGEGYLKAMDILCTSTPPTAKIMLLFENRGLYMPRHYVIGTPFFQASVFTPPERVTSPEQILATLKAKEIDYLLIGLAETDPDRLPAYLDRCTQFMQHVGTLIDRGLLVRVWEGEKYSIFKVSPTKEVPR